MSSSIAFAVVYRCVHSDSSIAPPWRPGLASLEQSPGWRGFKADPRAGARMHILGVPSSLHAPKNTVPSSTQPKQQQLQSHARPQPSRRSTDLRLCASASSDNSTGHPRVVRPSKGDNGIARPCSAGNLDGYSPIVWSGGVNSDDSSISLGGRANGHSDLASWTRDDELCEVPSDSFASILDFINAQPCNGCHGPLQEPTQRVSTAVSDDPRTLPRQHAPSALPQLSSAVLTAAQAARAAVSLAGASLAVASLFTALVLQFGLLHHFLHLVRPGMATTPVALATATSGQWLPPPPFLPFFGSPGRNRKGVTVPANQAASSTAVSIPGPGQQQPPEGGVQAVVLVAVVGAGMQSPYGASWEELIRHVSDRLSWTDPSFRMHVFTEQQLLEPGGAAEMSALLPGAVAVLGVALQQAGALAAFDRLTARTATRLVLDSGPQGDALTTVNGYHAVHPQGVERWAAELWPWGGAAESSRVWQTVSLLWQRRTSDDALFALLVVIDTYARPVPAVRSTTKGFDLDSIICMATNCGKQVVACVNDPTCKAALDCLQACTFNDQVCQYRCIVSHESPLLESFSLCILQLHNCRRLNAAIPMTPDPSPMPSWRDEAMSHELAEKLYEGWLGSGPHSWLVAAGKNPAYDFFPCQFQIFYRGKARDTMWYEPVFKVKTFDGREVWRRRRYRCKRGQVPGTFHFSVLDNGVTSNEFWRILDCAEDLQYCLFYYSGAAATAGLSYSGAVLATPDGRWPDGFDSRIAAALDRAGIKMWELSRVDNTRCSNAPLSITAARRT